MRRWTIMLIPHGSEAPRTWSLTERSLRRLIWTGSLAALLLSIGAATVISRVALLASPPVMAADVPGSGAALHGEGAALRARVAELDSMLDTIRSADDRLKRLVGSAAGDSVAMILRSRASADSLLEHASRVARGFAIVRDSSASRAGRPARESR